MSQSYPHRSTARASAVLTNAAVATSVFMGANAADGWLGVDIDFTLGSLTNAIVTPQVSPDNVTWYDVTSPGALTITASGNKAFGFRVGGWKFARVTCLGTGTVGGSLMAVRYAWIDRVGC